MLRQLSLAILGLNIGLTSQDVRELSTPVAHVNLVGVTASAITNQINNGYRLVDIEYRGVSLLSGTIYDAVFVQNTGAYAAGWWWYTGLTSAQVSSYLSSNQARLIDLEPYADGNGNLRFACIMVDNTGANAKAWWWYFNTSTTTIGTAATTNSARVVDLDSYVVNSTTYYSAVMIANTGADQRSWWWYINVTPAQISSYLNTNQARLYDLEPRSNGNWDCVMIRQTNSPAWYWWYGLSSADISYLLGNYGVRPIDLESYVVGSTRYWAMVAINNSNALTTDIGNAMRARTNGQVGCWLQRMNGGNLANLNGDARFEPASTMKTLHHVHAMRHVYLNTVALTTPINVFTNYSATNPSCPIDTGPISQPLQDVLRAMMENSDNARTQAIAAYFGQANINSTAAGLGMTGTSLNHRLGCAAPAIANPNQITLRDLNTLHEAVVNGYLGPYRPTFYELMLDSVNDLSVAAVINTEGAALSLPSATIQSFRNFTQMAHKGGNYILANGGPTYYHRAEFGWISLPFIQNDVITPREYGFGAFVNDSNNDTNAANAIYTDAIPELLRPTIRQALQSWTNSLAGVQSFGTGCGSPTAYAQTVIGLPRIGTALTYRGTSGFGSSLAILGIGFSSTSWNGIRLPASLTPYGSAPGCVALNSIEVNQVAIANSAGTASFAVTLPNATAFIGFEYLTQCYSFGPSNFRTSNAQRSIVGL
ncbi:MAG: serine hydrolase [Planctomycetes bacterium]|nr:serine hydrolase [Planctomycetota bacterium]